MPIHNQCAEGNAADPDMKVVGEAAHGWEAIARTRQLRLTLILMDVRMPLLNGIHATQKIKTEFPRLPVIGLMIFDNPEEASAMREAGAAVSIRKDRPPAELLGVMRRCVEPLNPSGGADAQGRADRAW